MKNLETLLKVGYMEIDEAMSVITGAVTEIIFIGGENTREHQTELAMIKKTSAPMDMDRQ